MALEPPFPSYQIRGIIGPRPHFTLSDHVMSKASTLTQQIISHLSAQGCYAWRSSTTGIPLSDGSWRSAPKKGVSDVLAICSPSGRTLAIEVKIGTDKLRPEQIGFLANIEHVGGLSYVASDFDEFTIWLSAQKFV